MKHLSLYLNGTSIKVLIVFENYYLKGNDSVFVAEKINVYGNVDKNNIPIKLDTLKKLNVNYKRKNDVNKFFKGDVVLLYRDDLLKNINSILYTTNNFQENNTDYEIKLIRYYLKNDKITKIELDGNKKVNKTLQKSILDDLLCNETLTKAERKILYDGLV